MASTDHTLKAEKRGKKTKERVVSEGKARRKNQSLVFYNSASLGFERNSPISHSPRSELAVCLPSHAGNTISLWLHCVLEFQGKFPVWSTRLLKLCRFTFFGYMLTKTTAHHVKQAAHTGVKMIKTCDVC